MENLILSPYLKEEPHLALRQAIREFAEKEVRPVVETIDQKAEFPADLVKKMAELGLMGMTVPERHGGAGMDMISCCVASEELARVWGSLHLIFSANNSLSCAPILEHGSEKQKQKYLPLLCSGEALGCFALTESLAGSDAANIRTRARRDNDEWIINGSKLFITNATHAKICVLIARTGAPDSGDKGMSAFIIESEKPGLVLPGLKVTKLEKNSMRSSPFAELSFQDVRLPAEALLGNLDQGFKIAMQTLDHGRINIASQSVGVAQSALDEALFYTLQRKTFGQLLLEHQDIAFELAKMDVRIEAARELTYKAAWLKDRKAPWKMVNQAASRAKYIASKAARYCADKAYEMFGGSACVMGMPIERILRDSLVLTIYEGTSNVQKMVIAGHLQNKARR